MSILPDEILSEILSPALKVSDELFSDTSDVSPFAKPSLSTSAYLVVCRDWLRVATPLLYNVVVLRSKSQANALEKVLVQNKNFGRFIKKLRVEGGYGAAMHTILKSAPNITDIFLTFVIYSSDSTQGLCKGLPLINPRRVILVDPNARVLKNKNLAALTEVLLSCIRKWDNLTIFDFPYLCRLQYQDVSVDSVWMTRATVLAEALANSVVRTVLLGSFWICPDFLSTLGKGPAIQVLQLKVSPWSNVKGSIDADERLKALVRYPKESQYVYPLSLVPISFISHSSPEPEENAGHSVRIPDIPPSLNPFFAPMESATDEIRERIWKHILFFAMCVEERRSFPCERKLPPRLPILLVSKYISRLALPYLFDCVNFTHRMASLGRQLEARPELGRYIRSIYKTHLTHNSPPSITIVSYTTNLQILSLNIATPPDHVKIVAQKAGSSLRELSIHLKDGHIASSVFAELRELRVLELSSSNVVFTWDEAPLNALDKLHTIRIKSLYRSASLFDTFSMMRLESLHTLQFETPPPDSAYWHGLVKFLKAHRTLPHLKLEYDPMHMEDFKLFDVCRALLDVEFITNSVDFNCTTPHLSLNKIIISTPRLERPELDPTMFPVLREVQIYAVCWPTTEREISQSRWVPLAEAWLEHGIKLTDLGGQHWIPRVKRSRGQ
ncbi:hypothetical protein DFH06DRAFT_155705 [Mycena polygramma]|nr:hypothetical protein DFH06DRAFT_155705 [Mycena polygramma]